MLSTLALLLSALPVVLVVWLSKQSSRPPIALSIELTPQPSVLPVVLVAWLSGQSSRPPQTR